MHLGRGRTVRFSPTMVAVQLVHSHLPNIAVLYPTVLRFWPEGVIGVADGGMGTRAVP